MTHRSTLPARPWLDGATYDKYSTPNMVHYDLYAWADAEGRKYFSIEVRERGRTLVAWSGWRYHPEFNVYGALNRDVWPLGLVQLYWTRATHDAFKAAHAKLLSMCVTPPAYSAKTVLCHYVKPYDGEPWPRGTLNTWAPPVYAEGKRPGRPRTKPTPVDIGDVL